MSNIAAAILAEFIALSHALNGDAAGAVVFALVGLGFVAVSMYERRNND
jgi:ABC-type Mn2+/Zn2+ transport system permease subunit